MKNLFALFTLLLWPGLALAEPIEDTAKNEELYAAIRAGNTDRSAEISFLKKTTHIKIPADSWPRMLDKDPYGGVTRSQAFAHTMLAYFDVNGHPGLRKLSGEALESELDGISKNYSFTFVYEGAANPGSWKNFVNYWGQIDNEIFHWGWAPSSGQAHFTVVVSPKSTTFSAESSDGKNFRILNPTQEVPTSQWEKNVRPLLKKHETSGKRP